VNYYRTEPNLTNPRFKKKDNYIMKIKFPTVSIVLLFLALTMLCCGLFKPNYYGYSKDVFLKAPNTARAHCDAKFVRSLPSDSTNYIFVGVCKSKLSTSSRGGNRALLLVNRCACHNGGDLVKIVDAREKIKSEIFAPNSSVPIRGPYSQRMVARDLVIAEVYRLK